jgi:hypothetical protein
MTPLNNAVNEYLGLEGTVFDTGSIDLISLFSGDYIPQQGYLIFYLQHTVLTFLPVIILVGVAFAL